MGITLARGILSFLMPGGLLFAAIIVLVQQDNFYQWLPALERMYPPAVAAVALLLGWRFDRSRLVFAAATIVIADRLLLTYGLRPDYVGRIVVDAVAVLLPLNLAVLALVKERGTLTWRGLLRWAFILAQIAAIAILLHYRRFDWLGIFDGTLVAHPWLRRVALEQPALIAFALAGLVTGINSFRSRNALDNGFFWALAIVFFALLTTKPGPLTTIYFATAILVLVIAVVELSYGMAFKDELTGLAGRRALNQALLKLGSRYSIAMMDIDHFKKFNDKYGHDVGDQVLRMVAAKLAQVSGGGRPYRYGGEEFTVIFPGKHIDDVLPHVEELRSAVENADFVVRHWKRPRKKPDEPRQPRKKGNKRVKITISIGVAERDGKSRSPQDVIKAADKALYRAKEAGRNRVES